MTRPQLDTSAFGLDFLGLIGFTPNGSTIVGVGIGDGKGASLVCLNADTLAIGKTIAHAGLPRTEAMSPDGLSLATGTRDGFVRVWDTKTGQLGQQMEFASQVQGVAFIDDRHLAGRHPRWPIQKGPSGGQSGGPRKARIRQMTDMIDWYEWPDREDEFVRGRREGEVLSNRHSAPRGRLLRQARGKPALAGPRGDPRVGASAT